VHPVAGDAHDRWEDGLHPRRPGEEPGQATPRAWLKWQTRTTTTAIGQAVGWTRRLAAHPDVERAP